MYSYGSLVSKPKNRATKMIIYDGFDILASIGKYHYYFECSPLDSASVEESTDLLLVLQIPVQCSGASFKGHQES